MLSVYLQVVHVNKILIIWPCKTAHVMISYKWMAVILVSRHKKAVIFSRNGDFWSLKSLMWTIVSQCLSLSWFKVLNPWYVYWLVFVQSLVVDRMEFVLWLAIIFVQWSEMHCFASSWVNAFHCHSGDPSTFFYIHNSEYKSVNQVLARTVYWCQSFSNWQLLLWFLKGRRQKEVTLEPQSPRFHWTFMAAFDEQFKILANSLWCHERIMYWLSLIK